MVFSSTLLKLLEARHILNALKDPLHYTKYSCRIWEMNMNISLQGSEHSASAYHRVEITVLDPNMHRMLCMSVEDLELLKDVYTVGLVMNSFHLSI